MPENFIVHLSATADVTVISLLPQEGRPVSPTHSACNHSSPMRMYPSGIGSFHCGIGSPQLFAVGTLICPITTNVFPASCNYSSWTHRWVTVDQSNWKKHFTPAPLCNVTRDSKCDEGASGALVLFLFVPEASWTIKWGASASVCTQCNHK